MQEIGNIVIQHQNSSKKCFETTKTKKITIKMNKQKNHKKKTFPENVLYHTASIQHVWKY